MDRVLRELELLCNFRTAALWALERLETAANQAQRRTLGGLLVELLRHIPGDGWTDELRDRARGAPLLPPDRLAVFELMEEIDREIAAGPARSLGKVGCMLVSEPEGAALGCLRRLVVHEFSDPIGGRHAGHAESFAGLMAPEFRLQLSIARDAVSRWLRDRGGGAPLAPAETERMFAFQLRPRERCPASYQGSSIGAAASLALASRWLGAPVDASIYVTGELLGRGGELGRVGGVGAKLRALELERPGFTLAIVPESNGGDIPVHLAADERVRTAATLDELLRLALPRRANPEAAPSRLEVARQLHEAVFAFFAEQNFPESLEGLERVLRQIEGRPQHIEQEFTCRWRIGSCLVHLGRTREAEDAFDQAEKIGDRLILDDRLSPADALGLQNSRAVPLMDRFLFEDAEALLHRCLERAAGLRGERHLRAKISGTLGQVLTAMGRPDEALPVLESALRDINWVERPREHCYLAEAHRRLGDLDAAREHALQGIEHNRAIAAGEPSSQVRANERFLRLALARVELDRDDPSEALHHSELALAPSDRYPAPLLQRTRGLALLRLGDDAEGLRALEAAAAAGAPGTIIGFQGRLAQVERALHLLGSGRAEAHDLEQALRVWDEYTPAAERFASELDELRATMTRSSRKQLQERLSHLLELSSL